MHRGGDSYVQNDEVVCCWFVVIGCLSGCTISPSNENHKEKKEACVILHEDTSGIAYMHYFIPVDANTGFQDEIEFVKTFE